MTEKEMDKALRILGPKVVNSIKRVSLKQMDDFEAKLNRLIEDKMNKVDEWYKPKYGGN